MYTFFFLLITAAILAAGILFGATGVWWLPLLLIAVSLAIIIVDEKSKSENSRTTFWSFMLIAGLLFGLSIRLGMWLWSLLSG
jgi:4-hydroxybenzoate polyprenyltransferase